MDYVEIDIETYIDMLEARRTEVENRFGWTTLENYPEIWEWFLGFIEECPPDREHSSPMYIIDNFIVNGSFGDFDMFKDKDETDEDFIEREKDNALYINEEKRSIVFNC